MEEYRQITLDEWTQWKEDIRRKLAETAGNFVHIGYRLKQIRDSGMYDGAADIFAFAEREYGLGKSTVSRFIAINEKYSEGGNSIELKEEFRGFSSSKLSEMLTLPDSEVELITEKTTIREIRELKAFNSRDPENTGEAAGKETGTPEEAAGGEERKWTPLEKCLIDYFKDKKDMLNDVMRSLETEPPAYKEASGRMAPSQTSHQKGIVFLFMYGWNTGVKYKLMAEPDPVSMSWEELLDTVYGIFGGCGQGDVWSDFYKEPEGGKEETEKNALTESNRGLEPVATSQQDEEKEKTEDQNGQEAAGGDTEEGRESETQEEACVDGDQAGEPAAGSEPADKASGADRRAGEDCAGGGADGEGGAGEPEMPEMTRTEAEPAAAADVEDSGEQIRDSDGLEQHIANQKELIKETLRAMGFRCDEGDWDGLIEKAREIITRAESIQNMEEMWHG